MHPAAPVFLYCGMGGRQTGQWMAHMDNNRSSKGISRPRTVFTFNCAVMIQHGTILLIVGPIVPSLMNTFGVGEAATGLMLGLGSLGFLGGPLIAGAIIDRGSVSRALIIGFIIEIVFLLLFGLSYVFILAVVANIFLHLGAAFVEISGSYLPIVTPGKSKAHVRMNLIHAFFSVGAFIGPFLIGLYIGSTGEWRPVFFFALILPVLLLLWLIVIRIPRSADAPSVDTSGATSAAETAGRTDGKAGLTTVLRSRWVVFGAISLLCYVGAEVGISSWIVYYLQQVMGLNTVQSSAGLSMLWIFIMIGRYLNSLLGGRVGAKSLVVISGIGGAIGVIIFLFVDGLAPAYILLSWIGLCLSGVFPNVMGELNNRDPKRAGMVTAVMTMGAALGAATFQWLVGLVADLANLKAALVIPAVLQALVVVSFLIALRSEAIPDPR